MMWDINDCALCLDCHECSHYNECNIPSHDDDEKADEENIIIHKIGDACTEESCPQLTLQEEYQ